jgi:diguanylate cyclase (GGDEF)-like protein/PAS domain S-box-containing protein
MDKHRFPLNFMRSVIVLGAAVLLFSIWRLPVSKLGLPYLVLLSLSLIAASRSPITVAGSRFILPVPETLAFFAMLACDGEAAVVLAACAGICSSLRFRRQPFIITFYAAFAALVTFVMVWFFRFSLGSLSIVTQDLASFSFLQTIFVAALIQSAFYGTQFAMGEAYKVKLSVWKMVLGTYGWMFALYLGGTLAAGISAALARDIGIGRTAVAALVITSIAFVVRSYQKAQTEEVQPVRYRVALRENSERFRSAFDHAAIGMALVSSEGRWLQVNRSLCGILGYTERELIQTDFLKITHPSDLAPALANIKELLKGKIATHQMEKRYIHKQGHEVWVHWSVSLARDSHTQTPHLIFQVQDITDRKRAEERLIHDAFHDALTSLPNRALFMDHLKLAIARGLRRPDHLFAVLYLDLDRFKVINDSLGHMIGDQLLVGIAKRLEICLRPGDTIARLGGDEFTILLEDVKDEEDVASIAQRIQEELTQPFNLGGRDVFTTVSIGIALSSPDYERPEDILRDADTAMYRAKTMGKARHEIFDKTMHAQAVKVLQIETDLRRAVERHEFFIEYQPIVNLETGRLRGFEALVRWAHPERGLISPGEFVSIAEETGLINPIGSWVLREACRQMRMWHVAFPAQPQLFMSVNLSGKQFAQANLINEVAAILKETNLSPESLKLEITESVVMENIEMATEMLQQLRALGLKLSIDDFGTGYSSLSYLHRFPIDTLKIDRSFVMQMSGNNENAEIVRTIIVLAQNLGMDVVAEGIETKEQCALLRSLWCEHGQGYFFSKAVSADAAEKFVMEAYQGTPMRPAAIAAASRTERAA